MFQQGLRHVHAFIVIVLAVAFMPGCGSRPFFEPREVQSHQQAGSAHVSVLSAHLWPDVEHELQPKFALDETTALRLVAPRTQRLDERFVDALRIAARIAPPITTRTESSTLTETIGSKPTETRTVTEEQKPGTLPEAVLGPATRPTTMPTPSESFLDDRPIEPQLQYALATALYQDVKLLNRYIRYFARTHGYDAYVIRLQVTVIPSARNQPYDTLVEMSLFPPSCVTQSHIAGAGRVDPTMVGGREIVKAPIFLPHLATDSLEGMVHARSMDEVREFAVSAALMIQSFGGQVDVNSFSEVLRSVIGQDYNSLLTIGRVADNTVRVRLGAMYQPSSQYGMIPRTHHISLTVLVPNQRGVNSHDACHPDEELQLSGIAKTTFVHALTGEPLPSIGEQVRRRQLEFLAKLHAPQVGHLTEGQIAELALHAESNDLEEFLMVLGPQNSDLQKYGPLWIDLLNFRSSRPYQTFAIPLPRHLNPMRPPGGLDGTELAARRQTILLFDDLTKTVGTLSGGEYIHDKGTA